MAKRSAVKLAALRRSLKPETWERRVAAAQAQVALIEAIERAKQEGGTYQQALSRLAPDMGQSTYRKRRARLRADGLEGLILARPGPAKPKTRTPEVEQAICILRRAVPDMIAKRISALVKEQTGITPSNATICRVLQAAGLNHPRGRRKRAKAKEPEPEGKGEELHCAGAALIDIVDDLLGYSRRMAAATSSAAQVLPAPLDGAVLRDEDRGRTGSGCFTAKYNQRRAKDGAGLGRAFRSVRDTRSEVNLRGLRLIRARRATLVRKWKSLVMSPVLTPTGKPVDLGDYRGGHAIREIAGIPYQPSTLDRHLRELKYAGMAEALCKAHDSFWQDVKIPAPASAEAEEAPTPSVYLDGVGEALNTRHFTRAGKVSNTGRVMPCLHQIFVHDEMGNPVLWRTFSGGASLISHTMPLLDELVARKGKNWLTGRLVVIDREGNSVGLFKKYDARDPVVYYVTILQDNQVDLGKIEDLTAWSPYRNGDEIAEGYAYLRDSHDRNGPLYRVRVIVIRRRTKGTLTVLATNSPVKAFPAVTVADAYFHRWKAQELRFRTANQATRFKRIQGFGKRLVPNTSVLVELTRLRTQRQKVMAQIARKHDELLAAEEEARVAKLQLNVAKARRKRQDNLVSEQLAAPAPDREKLESRIEVTQDERQRYSDAQSAVQAAAAKVLDQQDKLVNLAEKVPAIDGEIAKNESRKEIYEADTELQGIVTASKLGFVQLCQVTLLLFFAGMRISVERFIREVLQLPGTRTFDGMIEMISIKASRNLRTMEAVDTACQRVNALGVVRDGRVVQFSVDWSGLARKRGEKGP
jgi:transposase